MYCYIIRRRWLSVDLPWCRVFFPTGQGQCALATSCWVRPRWHTFLQQDHEWWGGGGVWMQQGQQRDANRISLYGWSTLDSTDPFPLLQLHIKSFFRLLLLWKEEIGRDRAAVRHRQGEQLHTDRDENPNTAQTSCLLPADPSPHCVLFEVVVVGGSGCNDQILSSLNFLLHIHVPPYLQGQLTPSVSECVWGGGFKSGGAPPSQSGGTCGVARAVMKVSWGVEVEGGGG